MYGNSMVGGQILKEGNDKVFNLSSLREDFITLRYLIPPNNIGRFTDLEFDIAYMNYIMQNDSAFMDFFRIIYELYIGNDVFIVASSEEDWSENILESLIKLIQQRYGYNAIFVGNSEDYIYAKNHCTEDFISGYGLYNLDQDKERFAYLVQDYIDKYKSMPFYLEGWYIPNDE